MALVLRDVRPGDLDGLLELAREFDTVNLPADRQVLDELIDRSGSSFRGPEQDPHDGLYLFVLTDTDDEQVLGSSMIVASHGTPEDPHNFLRIDTDERFSATLGRVFRHETLTFAQSYTPHTELGGLVLARRLRGHPRRLGRMLSWVRFFYMALHPGRFHDRIQAELLPPFEPDGSSRLWEWVGRRFTGLDYPEADRLSRANREFIPALFPRVPIYTALLPPEVREVLGAVGASTRGVERMLTSQGFTWNRNIDPFDGGPHYEARRDDIPLLGAVAHCSSIRIADGDDRLQPYLVRLPGDENTFEVVGVDAVREGDELICDPEAEETALLSEYGSELDVLPTMAEKR